MLFGCFAVTAPRSTVLRQLANIACGRFPVGRDLAASSVWQLLHRVVAEYTPLRVAGRTRGRHPAGEWANAPSRRAWGSGAGFRVPHSHGMPLQFPQRASLRDGALPADGRHAAVRLRFAGECTGVRAPQQHNSGDTCSKVWRPCGNRRGCATRCAGRQRHQCREQRERAHVASFSLKPPLLPMRMPAGSRCICWPYSGPPAASTPRATAPTSSRRSTARRWRQTPWPQASPFTACGPTRRGRALCQLHQDLGVPPFQPGCMGILKHLAIANFYWPDICQGQPLLSTNGTSELWADQWEKHGSCRQVKGGHHAGWGQ